MIPFTLLADVVPRRSLSCPGPLLVAVVTRHPEPGWVPWRRACAPRRLASLVRLVAGGRRGMVAVR